MCMLTFYHYTDREGLEGIVESRTIFRSPKGRYGPGVYLTRLSPRHGRKRIAKNNWDGIWSTTESTGKVDYAIAVRLPDHKVERYGEIYLFDEDVDLDYTTYKLFSKDGDHRYLESGHTDDESSEDDDDSGDDSSADSSDDSSEDEHC